MDAYKTAQQRINQLVGVRPTTGKNTFKNNTDMKNNSMTSDKLRVGTLYKVNGDSNLKNLMYLGLFKSYRTNTLVHKFETLDNEVVVINDISSLSIDI